MATIHSLVCWGGRTGKSVTMTIASPCVVTSTKHGLRDGTRLVFSTTGALPTGITAGVTYYAKSTAANTFNLYTDAALTNIVNTSGSQSGTHTAKSKKMLDYFAQYPGRWGEAGSERCYDGLNSWNTGRAFANSLDVEYCELGEAFSEIVTSNLTINVPCAAANIISAIDGIRTPAFHWGVVGAGYIYAKQGSYGDCLGVQGYRKVLDGFTVQVVSAGYQPGGVILRGNQSGARKMIAKGLFNGNGTGFGLLSAFAFVDRCLSLGWGTGISYGSYQAGIQATHCTAVQNTTGFYSSSTGSGFCYNNISIGNTTNWGTQSSSLEGGSNNAGLAGEAWMKTGFSRIELSAEWNGTEPLFENYAGSVFKPYASGGILSANSALIVDAAIEYYGRIATDIADAEQPNYNNGGSEAFDIGCYEYDHGYGDHPASTTVTFSGVHAGSEIRVYDASGNELAGVESSTANPELTWVLSTGDVRIVIVHPNYRIKEFAYTSSVGNQTIPVQQEPDKWYNNPA